MIGRAGFAIFCAGAPAFLPFAPVMAQMEAQPGPGPVDPNASPGSLLNPRKSLIVPQPVRPDPVDPSLRSPPTPYPEALRPGRAPAAPGYTITREKPRAGREASAPGALDKPRQISDALLACWRPPASPVQQQVTIRIAFNRQGAAIGEPRITYVSGPPDAARRDGLRRSMLAAVSACLPLRFTPGLASAIAGRPFAIRFIAPAR